MPDGGDGGDEYSGERGDGGDDRMYGDRPGVWPGWV
jgi:hypothetical protein